MDLKTFLSLYQYESDKTKLDHWSIPKLINGKFEDDCDGFCLGVLYFCLAEESLFKFWLLLVFYDTKIIYCKTKSNVGHVVLKHKGKYIDTFSKEWVDKQQMLNYGHKFNKLFMFNFLQIALKMLIGKILVKMK